MQPTTLARLVRLAVALAASPAERRRAAPAALLVATGGVLPPVAAAPLWAVRDRRARHQRQLVVRLRGGWACSCAGPAAEAAAPAAEACTHILAVRLACQVHPDRAPAPAALPATAAEAAADLAERMEWAAAELDDDYAAAGYE